MILGKFYTRNVYPQSLHNFTRNDFGYVRIIPAMFTRSRLRTLPAMILGRYYTRNVYPQSLNNFTRNDFGYVLYPQCLPAVA